MPATTDASRARRLEDKTAVIFGAGGEVGSAVAKELAAQGGRVFPSGRTKARVQELAEAISSRGATAAAAEQGLGKVRGCLVGDVGLSGPGWR